MSQHHYKKRIAISSGANTYALFFFALLFSLFMPSSSFGSVDLNIDNKAALLNASVTASFNGQSILDLDSSGFLLEMNSKEGTPSLLIEIANMNSRNQGDYIIDGNSPSIVHSVNQIAFTAFDNDEYHDAILKKMPLVIYNLNKLKF